MGESVRLRDQAAKCRRLAGGMTDERTVGSLLEVAHQYEAEAAEIEAKGDSEPFMAQPSPGGNLHA